MITEKFKKHKKIIYNLIYYSKFKSHIKNQFINHINVKPADIV